MFNFGNILSLFVYLRVVLYEIILAYVIFVGYEVVVVNLCILKFGF